LKFSLEMAHRSVGTIGREGKEDSDVDYAANAEER
jgi:hypothetical protein